MPDACAPDGMIAISAAEPNATCDAQTLDPAGDLPEGFARPANDPVFAICSPPYAISLSRHMPEARDLSACHQFVPE